MPSALKLVTLFIVTPPAAYYGLKYTLQGAYRGIVLRRIPMGDDVSDDATSAAALAIGVYSACMAGLILFALGYLALWAWSS